MSWYQLVSIIRSSIEEVRLIESRPPLACPNDGEPLREGRVAGTLFCPFDGYHWPNDSEQRC